MIDSPPRDLHGLTCIFQLWSICPPFLRLCGACASLGTKPRTGGRPPKNFRAPSQDLTGTILFNIEYIDKFCRPLHFRRWFFADVAVFGAFYLFGTVVCLAAALHFAMVVFSCGGLVCIIRRPHHPVLHKGNVFRTFHCSQLTSVSKLLARGTRGLEIPKSRLFPADTPQIRFLGRSLHRSLMSRRNQLGRVRPTDHGVKDFIKQTADESALRHQKCSSTRSKLSPRSWKISLKSQGFDFDGVQRCVSLNRSLMIHRLNFGRVRRADCGTDR